MKYELIDKNGSLKQPEIILTLGGGAARGFAHVGAYKVLCDYGFKIKSICGNSMGAICGAMMAAGFNYDKIVSILDNLKNEKLIEINWKNLFNTPLKYNKIINFIAEKTEHKNIEDLPIPFSAVAVNNTSNSKLRYVFKNGPIGTAVAASSSNPYLKNVEYENMSLSDGYEFGNCPYYTPNEIAEQLELTNLPHLAIEIKHEEKKTFFDMLASKVFKQSNAVLDDDLQEKYKYMPDYLLPIDVHVSQMSFYNSKAAIKTGEIITKMMMPDIINELYGITEKEFLEHIEKYKYQTLINKFEQTTKISSAKSKYAEHTRTNTQAIELTEESATAKAT